MARTAKPETGGSIALFVVIGIAGMVLLVSCVGIGVLGWVYRANLGFSDAIAKEGVGPGPDGKGDDNKVFPGKPGEKIVTDAEEFATKLLSVKPTDWKQLVGRPFEVTGTVQMVAPGFFYLDGVQGNRFLCRPAPNFADMAARLPMGNRVKVEGKCTRAWPPDVHLDSCVITVLAPQPK